MRVALSGLRRDRWAGAAFRYLRLGRFFWSGAGPFELTLLSALYFHITLMTLRGSSRARYSHRDFFLRPLPHANSRLQPNPRSTWLARDHGGAAGSGGGRLVSNANLCISVGRVAQFRNQIRWFAFQF